MQNPLEFVTNVHMENIVRQVNWSLPEHVEWLPFLTLPSVPFEQRKGLPACAAVYFVHNAQRYVLYVGQANNLARRWYRHEKLALLRECQAAYLSWISMDNALLNAVEAAFIAAFRPSCNLFIPSRLDTHQPSIRRIPPSAPAATP